MPLVDPKWSLVLIHLTSLHLLKLTRLNKAKLPLFWRLAIRAPFNKLLITMKINVEI